MLNINLVPEVKKEQARLKKINITVTTVAVIVGGALLAVVLLLASLYGYRATRISSVGNDIKKIESDLSTYKELEKSVDTLETGLAEINKIVAGGRNWTSILEQVEAATPADIQFNSFQIAGNSVSASLTGGNIKSIDRFIKSFTGYKNTADQNMFANVVVDGYSLKDGTKVTFQAKFDIVGETK